MAVLVELEAQEAPGELAQMMAGMVALVDLVETAPAVETAAAGPVVIRVQWRRLASPVIRRLAQSTHSAMPELGAQAGSEDWNPARRESTVCAQAH